MNPRQFALPALLLAPLVGCAGTAMPNWCNPGPAWYQMAEARQYDPFPEPNIAPPILGGRPLGWRTPRFEPDIVKDANAARIKGIWPFAGYQPAPSAGAIAGQAPLYAAPAVAAPAVAAPAPVPTAPNAVAYPPPATPFDPYAPQAPSAYGTPITTGP